MDAILLAAGFSSRMGRLKQVMPIAGTAMVRRVAQPLLDAGLELIVVVGHERQRVQAVLQDLPCRVVVNEEPEAGMFSSVRLGCRAVPDGEGCLISTGDCPGIQVATIRQIMQAMPRHPDNVIIPSYQHRRGHPAGLPPALVQRIRELPPDTPGLNSLWRAHPDMLVHLPVDDPAILRDLDRPEDLAEL